MAQGATWSPVIQRQLGVRQPRGNQRVDETQDLVVTDHQRLGPWRFGQVGYGSDEGGVTKVCMLREIGSSVVEGGFMFVVEKDPRGCRVQVAKAQSSGACRGHRGAWRGVLPASFLV